MKHLNTFEYFLLEQELNEIGEGSAPFPWKRVGPVSVDRNWMTTLSQVDKSDTKPGWTQLPNINYEFKSDKATYNVRIAGGWARYVHISFGRKPGAAKPQDFNLVIVVSFDVVGSEKEVITNFGEQFRVITTVTEIVDSLVKEIAEWQWVKLTEIRIAPKLEDSEEGVPIAQSKRGRLYLEYIKKQGHRLPGSWTAIIQDDMFVLMSGVHSGTTPGKYIPL
jgi:hypothetical protein